MNVCQEHTDTQKCLPVLVVVSGLIHDKIFICNIRILNIFIRSPSIFINYWLKSFKTLLESPWAVGTRRKLIVFFDSKFLSFQTYPPQPKIQSNKI